MAQIMTGKQAVLEMLKAEGVKHIFGNPGTSEAPLIDMLGDYPELQYFLTLQESVQWVWENHTLELPRNLRSSASM